MLHEIKWYIENRKDDILNKVKFSQSEYGDIIETAYKIFYDEIDIDRLKNAVRLLSDNSIMLDIYHNILIPYTLLKKLDNLSGAECITYAKNEIIGKEIGMLNKATYYTQMQETPKETIEKIEDEKTTKEGWHRLQGTMSYTSIMF